MIRTVNTYYQGSEMYHALGYQGPEMYHALGYQGSEVHCALGLQIIRKGLHDPLDVLLSNLQLILKEALIGRLTPYTGRVTRVFDLSLRYVPIGDTDER